jgi:hypothetical protein
VSSVRLYDALEHLEAARASLPTTLPLRRAHDLLTEALGIVGDAIDLQIAKEQGADDEDDLSDWDALIPTPVDSDWDGTDDGSFTLTLDEYRQAL